MRKVLFLSLLLLAPVLLSAQTQKLTLDDILGGGRGAPGGGGGFRGRGGEGQLTPDGKHSVTQEDGQIVLKLTNGGTAKVLTSSPGLKSEVVLSPDGRHIAYLSDGQVWVVTVGGGDALQLTHDPKGPGDPRGATDQHPQWNPNGKWILHDTGTKGYNELYVVSEDGKVRTWLAATEIYHGKDAIAINVAADHGDAVSSDRFDAVRLGLPTEHASPTRSAHESFSPAS
jgi:WD40 repeat protein